MPRKQSRKYPIFLAVFAFILSLTLTLPFGAHAQAQSEEAKKNYQQAEKFSADKDYKKAAQFYTKAAEQGHLESQYHLGMLYLSGRGIVDHDHAQATKWLGKAAKGGERCGAKRIGLAVRTRIA